MNGRMDNFKPVTWGPNLEKTLELVELINDYCNKTIQTHDERILEEKCDFMKSLIPLIHNMNHEDDRLNDLIDSLGILGIRETGFVGEQYDPRIHNIVAFKDSKSEVSEVLRHGWTIDDEVFIKADVNLK